MSVIVPIVVAVVLFVWGVFGLDLKISELEARIRELERSGKWRH